MDTLAPPPGPEPKPATDLQSPSADPAHESDTQREQLAARILALQQVGRRGANWFYWVAGLSLVNSVLIHVGANIYFVVGMGVSLIGDMIADSLAKEHPNAGVLLRAAAIGFAAIAAGVASLFGWLANRRSLFAYALGMVLYLLDGLIFLAVQDWLSVAFHAFALFAMWAGFRASRELNAIETRLREHFPESSDQVNADDGHEGNH